MRERGQVVFLASGRWGKRTRHIKLFFKDMPRDASYGDKLSVFVVADRDRDPRRPDSAEQSQRGPPRTHGPRVGRPGTAAPEQSRKMHRLEELKQSACIACCPFHMLWNRKFTLQTNLLLFE